MMARSAIPPYRTVMPVRWLLFTTLFTSDSFFANGSFTARSFLRAGNSPAARHPGLTVRIAALDRTSERLHLVRPVVVEPPVPAVQVGGGIVVDGHRQVLAILVV